MSQNPERPHRRRAAWSEREADREQAKREAEHEGQRGMSEPNKLDPTPRRPDDTLISDVEFPARIRKVLTAAGLKTVGDVRETSDDVRIPPAETVLFGDRLPRKHVALRLALRSVDAGRGSGWG
jgi:hypothetical protein